MTSLRTRLCRTVLLAAAALTASVFAQTGPPGVDPRVDDRAIVHVRPDCSLAAFVDAFEANHPEVTLTAVETIAEHDMHLLAVGLPDPLPPGFVDALALDMENNYLDCLVSGEFLYANEAPEGKSGSTFVDGLAEHQYELQFSRGLLGLDAAHARSTGAGIVIALLDTGLDAGHPTLAGRVAPGGWDFVDGDADVDDGANGLDDDGDGETDEMAGHGTFVAGLLAIGAPDARLLPVRVLDDDGVGDGWRLTQGLHHAIGRGVEVINLSLGSTYNTATVEYLIEEVAEQAGIVVVSSAGNLDRNDPEEFPATGSGLGIAATDAADVKAPFSNYHKDLALSAPGTDGVVSTLPGGGYGAWEGTSFATPFVAAAAALVRAQHPEWPPNAGTASVVGLQLAVTSADIYAMNPAYAKDEELGAGRLDVAAAVAIGPPAPAPADLDGNGTVDFQDLLSLLGDWGQTHSSADLDGDGTVGFEDLLRLLVAWG